MSASWSECLNNWASFYESLYSGETVRNFQPIPIENSELDDPFTFSELVFSVNELKDNKAPGEDLIMTDDFTVLLHTDFEDPDFVLKNREK